MLLIHVIAGQNRLVLFAEFDGSFGIAFEIGSAEVIIVVDAEGGEHFAFHFVDEDFGAEGRFFGGGGFGNQIFPDFVGQHRAKRLLVESDENADLIDFGLFAFQLQVQGAAVFAEQDLIAFGKAAVAGFGEMLG